MEKLKEEHFIGLWKAGQSIQNRYYSNGNGFVVTFLKSNGRLRKVSYRGKALPSITHEVHEFEALYRLVTDERLNLIKTKNDTGSKTNETQQVSGANILAPDNDQ